MTKQEYVFFDQLTKDRAENAQVLEKTSMRGTKNSVIDKYRDQAHFIYELLQNADDAGATSARFILFSDKLIFAHNGTRLFTVTDPDSQAEDRDTRSGTLGDINAITSVANSNKTEASIGKFGVGFKAVFQYTESPYIYGPNIKFRIDRFVVPSLIKDDYPDRQPNETLFVFPFNHSERSAKEAFEDISAKLKSLSFPTLFLSSLCNISFEIGNIKGTYRRNVVERHVFSDTLAEKTDYARVTAEVDCHSMLWLFSRNDEKGRRYCVGFAMNDKGSLCPINIPAFCFFPTKEDTRLNFIIHAPFLLTDSREGIRAGIPHNEHMVELLSALAADSLVYLRDIGLKAKTRLITDDIIDIIPIDESVFSDATDRDRISFLPFYTAIKEKIGSEALLPACNGYVYARNAYWASVPKLNAVFQNKQLAEMCGDENAKWVFTSFGRDEVQRKREYLCSYIDDVINTWLDEDDLINGWHYENDKEKIGGVTSTFIEQQDIVWLHVLYKWLSETDKRTEAVKSLPVFLDQNRNPVAAYNEDGQLILFLPAADNTDYITVNAALLENTDTKAFLKKIGIKEPELRDEIFNKLIPAYAEGCANRDVWADFRKFFKYYTECPQSQTDEYMELISECQFVVYQENNGEVLYIGMANELYFPDDKLVQYFGNSVRKYLAINEYESLISEPDKKFLRPFFAELGVDSSPVVIEDELDCEQANKIKTDWPYSSRDQEWTIGRLDGCEEAINQIVAKKSESVSLYLWNQLLRIAKDDICSWQTLSSKLGGTYHYFYYSRQETWFESDDVKFLRHKPWLVSKNGKFVSASNISVQSLSDEYDVSSDAAKKVIDFLQIKVSAATSGAAKLTAEQQKQIELAEYLQSNGIDSMEELDELIQLHTAKRQRQLEQSSNVNNKSDVDNSSDGNGPHMEINRVGQEVIRRAHSTSENVSKRERTHQEAQDEDEYTHPTIDYSKKIERAKDKSASELESIARLEELQEQAINAEKYSFAWFSALLELEALGSDEASSGSREVSISFAKVEREPGTARTLILKDPSRYIPQFMEDLADIPLVLHFGDQTKTVAIEVANIHSYTLRVKLKTNAEIDGIDLCEVTEARIDAKSPAFLIEELRKQFDMLDYEPDFNMQKNLCQNIEFVFGPPGTGKTTHLARNVLMPWMVQQEDVKVLVLTPTNKAADVLVKRIMEVSGDELSYTEWLVRFGSTIDEQIEDSPIYRDKTFDIRKLRRNVTVTTIARFPYDYFMPQGKRLSLCEMNWDYIVIDEASMIPLVNIIYALYKKTPHKFVIAGDPFQIEPITSVDLWKNENIYTMVHLDSFTAPKTTPYQYKVELLTTQYRSVPAIGEVFSKFSYGGILHHYRNASSQRKLSIGNGLNLETLNLIKFPVSKYESIYRSKRLQKSSAYQIYSALFSFELVNYLASEISKSDTELFRIGVIAPYRAQADLIDKLVSSASLPKSVAVQVGTIHGFQGDECDMIIAVFNTPPSISTSKDMFLNKQNIINVSISRARDYLLLVMPDDDTDNIGNLRLVKKVEDIIKASGSFAEFKSNDIEKAILGNANYLEDNSFSTSHHNVNVYGVPEKCYEIRSEDSAIDIQIHRQGK